LDEQRERKDGHIGYEAVRQDNAPSILEDAAVEETDREFCSSEDDDMDCASRKAQDIIPV
jgi:hypothetical protein